MNEEQKYSELLKELGKVLHDKNQTIWLQEYEISSLTKKLAEAEHEIEMLKKGVTNE